MSEAKALGITPKVRPCPYRQESRDAPCPLSKHLPTLGMNPDPASENDYTNSTATGERRKEPRIDSVSAMRLSVESCCLEGVTENVSGIGVLFFAGGDLRVSVELEENGARVTRKGRLVRVQRMSPENTGFAVEFDTE